MELHLKIIGAVLIVLALAHLFFPKYFNWTSETKHLSLVNRQIFYVHTFFIAFIVFLMGLLCLTSATEVIDTPLGRKIALGLGVFWIVRLFVQLFVYSSKLWKGKIFETAIHIIFSLFWAYVGVVFLSVYFL